MTDTKLASAEKVQVDPVVGPEKLDTDEQYRTREPSSRKERPGIATLPEYPTQSEPIEWPTNWSRAFRLRKP
jgi:hypothetical protein